MHNKQLSTHSASDYSASERKSFKKQDLRGQSFKGEDLSGLDFSGADIRGTNFTNAILRNADFSHAITGLNRAETIALSVVLLATALLLGTLAGFIGATIGLQFHTNALEISAKAIAVLVHIGFLLIALRKGITAGFSIFALALALAFAAVIIHSAAIPIAGAIAIAIVIDFCVAAVTIVAAIVAIVARIAMNTRIAWAAAAIFVIAFAITLHQTRTSVAAVAIATTAMILSAYVGWRTLRLREQIRVLGRTVFARWGTSFRGSDLTGANFSQAVLKNTDFRRATLTKTYWNEQSIGILEGL
ncbi:MAG: pentapeptide repeat-containing protein [Drouetiella hepatica Uher 2000/2452]|jgi:hypothetical protein|uniref:Pentapeptide repeat-containing protein n=1 Tax=Drouetiella hepatica Uher 2000/2452 TaxID=904376 RepID=A0A951QDC6_9CYAN|nr:pentapeptide repeat-containing protein [Drouetiella hepatica Uher 2000/2452]